MSCQAWGELEEGARTALASAAALVPQAEAAAGRMRELAVEAEAAARHAHPLLVERQRPSNRSRTGQRRDILDGRLATPSFLLLGLLDSSSDQL